MILTEEWPRRIDNLLTGRIPGEREPHEWSSLRIDLLRVAHAAVQYQQYRTSGTLGT